MGRVQYNGFHREDRLDKRASVRAGYSVIRIIYWAHVAAGPFSEVIREATIEDMRSADFVRWADKNDRPATVPVATDTKAPKDKRGKK